MDEVEAIRKRMPESWLHRTEDGACDWSDVLRLLARIKELEASLDVLKGECGDGRHGPWCREWDAMVAEHARLIVQFGDRETLLAAAWERLERRRSAHARLRYGMRALATRWHAEADARDITTPWGLGAAGSAIDCADEVEELLDGGRDE